ncbi:hypothetical protein OG21DRAFT_1578175 [Imleria badia]|nr:hypothetical protein OG21DRAFT_1578175 [Imleria badia]
MTVSTSNSISDTFQDSFYVGINIENILYIYELILYFKTMGILVSNRGMHKKFNLFYALFSSIMMFSVTVWVATSAIFGEKMWLLDSDFPEGPDMHWKKNISDWYMDWAMTAVILFLRQNVCSLGWFQIYRCRIIWNSYRAIVIPIILWLSTLSKYHPHYSLSTGRAGGKFFAGVASQLGLAYYTVSVFLNTVSTGMVCYRMLRHGRSVREHLGQEYASSYFAVVTLVVESVLPYTMCGIAFLVSLGVGSPTSVAFVCVYFLMMCISPQILILRVLARRAWDNDTSMRPGSTINFGSEGTSGSQWFDSTRVQTLSKVYIPETAR